MSAAGNDVLCRETVELGERRVAGQLAVEAGDHHYIDSV